MDQSNDARRRRLTRCVYWAMVNRCSSERSPQWPNYGGRGIRVCPQWSTPEAFIRDMGYKPDGMTLERIDVDGHYSPENCRWATRREQANNKRTNALVIAWGATKTAAQWSEITGVDRQSIANRVNRLGWPSELAVFTPVGVRLRSALVFQQQLRDLPAMLAAAGLDKKGRRK